MALSVRALDTQNPSKPRFPWRDAAVVVAVTLATAFLGIYFEASERLFEATRGYEHLQLDELPAAILALALALMWFAWRRQRELSDELARRLEVERQIESLLADNRRLAQRYMQAQEAERKHLARELHDEMGQYLNAIRMDALAIEQRIGEGEPEVRRAAGAIAQHASHVYASVRDLIGTLRPVGLDDLGLRAALEHCLAHWQQRLPDVAFSMAFEGDVDSLGEEISLAIYRLTQEALTNVSRHAAAANVHVRLARVHMPGASQDRHQEVMLEIADDGRGADLQRIRFGLGLIGMRERIEMLGGTLQVASPAGKGFRIDARIPVATHGQAAT